MEFHVREITCRASVNGLMQVTKDAPLQKKEVDDVLGGADAWKNAPKTDGVYKQYFVSEQTFFMLSYSEAVCLW